MRLAVLASGRGSNLQALLEAEKAGALGKARVAVVLSNVKGAVALERASRAGVPTEEVEHGSFPDRSAFERAMLAALAHHRVELVALAGFMRLLSPLFLKGFPGRILNIHPSLLPAFPGLHPARQALAYGVRLSGATVHFVEEATDAGPILLQAAVPVLPGDDEERLSARILTAEHRLYPAAVRLVAEGRVTLEGRQVKLAGATWAPEAPIFNPKP